MELVGLPENPVPAGAIMVPILAQDGLKLRAARWTQQNPRGTVVLLQGRAECIEKYFETIEELRSRQLDVVALDWRGQGGSERELSNPRKGHIDDFQIYGRDLMSLARQVLEPFCPKPWFALAHSMGAAIVLAQAHDGPDLFERMVLCTPMIGLYGLKYPRLARVAAETLDIAGFGGAFLPGGYGKHLTQDRLLGNFLTSDPIRFQRYGAVSVAAPQLTVGDPTIGWTNAAFRLMRRFVEPDFARRTLTPTLVLAAGDDRVVDTRVIESFASRLKAGRHITIPYARHDLFLERDEIRSQLWAAFDAFIPGTQQQVVLATKQAAVL